MKKEKSAGFMTLKAWWDESLLTFMEHYKGFGYPYEHCSSTVLAVS